MNIQKSIFGGRKRAYLSYSKRKEKNGNTCTNAVRNIMQQNVPVADRRFADSKSIAHAVNIGTAHLKAHAGYSGFGNSINLTIAGNACNGSNSKIR